MKICEHLPVVFFNCFFLGHPRLLSFLFSQSIHACSSRGRGVYLGDVISVLFLRRGWLPVFIRWFVLSPGLLQQGRGPSTVPCSGGATAALKRLNRQRAFFCPMWFNACISTPVCFISFSLAWCVTRVLHNVMEAACMALLIILLPPKPSYSLALLVLYTPRTCTLPSHGIQTYPVLVSSALAGHF